MNIKTSGVLLGTLLIISSIYSMEDEFLWSSCNSSFEIIPEFFEDEGKSVKSQMPETGLDPSLCVDTLESVDVAVGDDIDEQDFTGKTALHYLVMAGSLECIKRILSIGATIDVQDAKGKTPVHYALDITDQDLSYEIVEILVRNGASVLIEDENGRIPQECTQDAKLKYFLARTVDCELLKKCPSQQHQIIMPTFVTVYVDTDILLKDLQVQPPLDQHLCTKCPKLVKILLATGQADPRGDDATGKPALHHRMIKGGRVPYTLRRKILT